MMKNSAKRNLDLERIVERNLEELENSISTKTGLKVAEIVTKIADKESVEWAIEGGLAMHLYGFDRSTKDVDFIASGKLSLAVKRRLNFGGERYEIKTGKKTVAVDWILRRDDYKDFYRQALEDMTEIRDWKILTPEWLVILKYIAGRAKDRLDLLWLLQQKGLVSRKIVYENLVKVLGKKGAKLFLLGLQREYDLADLSAGKSGDENESYESDPYPEYNV